jgi:hypothetical protein
LSADSNENVTQSQPEILELAPRRKRRFSHESTNDLLFWGVQLLVVAISMAIIYSKLETTAKILRTLLSEQDSELSIAKAQAVKADEAVADSQRRLDEAEAHRSAFWKHASEQLDGLLNQVTQIQSDVKESLANSAQTNQLVLAAAEQSKEAAGNAALQATRAAGTSDAAVNAAIRAERSSSHTGTVIASKVVTAQDKRALQARERQLAAKQRKLTQTIKRVKTQGPNLFEKLLHP